MPPVLLAVPGALIAGGIAAIEGASLIGALEAGGLSLALGAIGNLLTPSKPKSAGSSTSTPLPFPFSMQPADSRRWCYGRGATGGAAKYWCRE